MSFESTIDHAVRDLAEEATRAVTDHPEPEELVDYQEGRLAEEEAKQVRQHLVACSKCAQEVLDLETFDFDNPEDAELRPSAAETTEAWVTFQRQSTEEVRGARVLDMARGMPAPPTASTVQRGLKLWAPLAASILIALTGLGFWIAGIAERGHSATPIQFEASANPYVFDLLPDGEGHRRNASTSREVVVPAGMDLLIPRLNLGDQTPYATYRAEILDAAGTPIWSQSELRRQPAGQFIVLVKRASLPVGEYRFRLVGLTDGEETVLATYSFRLRYPPTE